MQYGKAYPYLKALLDASIEAAPNWAKAPGKFVSSLSEQLKTQGQEENKQLEKEIKALSQDQLCQIIKEAGFEQKEDIELIAGKVKLIPEILRILDYRFDKVDEKLEEIKRLLLQEQPSIQYPLPPSLHNQTPPEPHFVGRKDMLQTITQWYNDPDVRIGALVGWGGVGKSALVRKWYDSLHGYKIKPAGIFWWGFYRNAHLELFLNALLRFAGAGQIEPESIKSTWVKTDTIKQYIHQRPFLIILDGLEQMQKPGPADQFGRMTHPEFTEVLHYLAEAHQSPGLCLITTRYELKDLDQWLDCGYAKQPLIDLSPQDAISMLRKRRIKGTDEQLKEVVNRYKGHALSLTLMAGFLHKYHGADITKAPDIKFVLSGEKRFKDVNKLLNKYAEKMSKAERVFLNIFSLFRQEITEDDFAGVFRHKIEGTKFNDGLIKMTSLDFKDLITGLVDWRLISLDKTKNTYTAHPLIKTYFESDFENDNKTLCHKRIYQYFGENAPELPETLDQMQPLFEQVHHGCAAGLYDEVFDDAYWEKINRGQEYFLTHKLGAWETELSLATTFFPKGDFSKLPLVTKRTDQGWLLNTAALALKKIGRPKEGQEGFLTAIRMAIQNEDFKNASIAYQTSTDLQFRTGDLAAALNSAEKALELSKKADSDKHIRGSNCYLAWILFLSGETQKAQKNFKHADELSKKMTGHRLCTLLGIFYADFAMSINKIDEAYQLTKPNLEICQANNWGGEVSRCHRCLAAIQIQKNNLQQAKEHLQEALDIGREVGMPELEMEALIESARLNLKQKQYKDAIRNADDVLKLCARTDFIFYEPDAEIILSRAHLAEVDLEQAKTFANSAYKKAVSMKYRWAEGDAAHLLGQIYLADHDPKNARLWLKKAIACRSQIKDPDVKESEKLLAVK